MSDFEPTNPHEPLSGRPVSSATSDPTFATSAGSAAPPPPQPDSGSASAPTTTEARRSRVRRLLENRRSRWTLVAAAVMCALIGGSVGLATSRSTTAAQPVAAGGLAGGNAAGGGATNARSGPAAGGASGAVSSVSPSNFTITTSAGQKVTVDEAAATTYQNGTNSTSANAITTGESVLVLGTTSGTTITATQVVVQPAGGGSVSSSAAGVIPFQRGAQTTSKQVGQVPANYSQGSGTIVSGTTANNATEAALAAYPGGVVDRVVQLSNGQFEVHYIGVNWPHHIFVNQDFNVVGAN
jgi:hypothetical protein